ncbi:hypothetical protein BC940DRAFT_371721 [Gongronella butleri]|nr:hypothetical protein BC940DRAFT_371721 [Gongronella butleri]
MTSSSASRCLRKRLECATMANNHILGRPSPPAIRLFGTSPPLCRFFLVTLVHFCFLFFHSTASDSHEIKKSVN